jgi:ABC-type branched-subunit amino acid transport system substrate-binding protein
MKPATHESGFERRSVSLKESLQKLESQPLAVDKENDGTLVVAIMLPFKAESSTAIINSFLEQRENKSKAKPLSEETKAALDFYDGALLALKKIEANQNNKLKIELNFFDTWGSDSVVNELMKEKAVVNADVIIGPATHDGAKRVAEFCKQRKIVNVQPFSPAKSIASDNPYHVKIAPTIEAHIDNMVRSIADSFLKENIIIYSTSNPIDWQTAARLDSILHNFDGPGKTRFNVTFFNASNPVVKGEKKALSDLLSATKTNVVIACVFEEANAQMVVRQLAAAKPRVVLYGMPTWLNSEILRLDYLNKLNTRFTEQFVEDTIDDKKAIELISMFREVYNYFPPKFAWLGYDVINWLYKAASESDRFPENIQGSFYPGAGYKFQFRVAERKPRADEKKGIDYYENTFLHLLRIENFTLIKEW